MSNSIDKDIAAANLNAFGWKLGNHIHSTPFNSHVFYLRDFRDGQIHLLTVGQQDFNSARTNLDMPIGSHVEAIAQLIKKSGKKALSQKNAGALSFALVNYIKSTGAYRQWATLASPDERMHAVMNLYSQKNGLVRLRPFIVRHDELMLTPNDVMQSTEQIFVMDKARNPDWFS
ncbi:TPA: hypothetical protein RG501_RS13195 [Providencia rettgeri]|nr:hypothetical protein [Providencia rettgeri]